MAEPIVRLNTALEGRYMVERELGHGGMATVYLATDLKHGRQVALKVLHPELAASLGADRFAREIEIAARLTHPHILSLLDSGVADGLLFYTMPYIDGESLAQRLDREGQLPLDDALQLTSAIADALGHAHAHGVIHRDIKPANILLADGQPVVADFGIAKAISEAGAEKLTETGLAVGTPHYMSPEQAEATGRIDRRSDVYSLACMFYHMVVGEPPFTGPSAQAILARHALDPVAPVSTVRGVIPPSVDVVLSKALAKAPADRYASATAFATALEEASREDPTVKRRRSTLQRSLAGAALVLVVALGGWWAVARGDGGPNIERLAVLPPVAGSTTPDREPVVLGMYSALLTELGQAGVTVIGSLQSMQRYRTTTMTVAEIAAELGVDAVIEPTIYWAGDSVGLGVRMIDGRSEEALWSRSWEADARNVVTLYRQVTRGIAAEIQLALTPSVVSHLATARSVNPEAYEAWLQGRFYSGKLTPSDLETATEYFNLALEKDPDFAPAYAGLSWVWIASQQMGYVSPAEATPKAVEAARHALALDSLLAEGHHSLATAEGWASWDWERGERGLRRAIALNPADGDARADYSHFLLVLKRFEEAERQIDSALARDPMNLRYIGFRAVIYMNTGQRDKGFQEFRRMLRVAPNHPVALSVLADVSHELGREDSAVYYQTTVLELTGEAELASVIRKDYEEVGYREAMRQAGDLLARGAQERFVPPMMVAKLYAHAGDVEQTLHWLERGVEGREPNLPYIGVTPLFDFVRGEPRFKAILEAMHLPWVDD